MDDKTELLNALNKANEFFINVLPKVNFGASFFDAKCIELLNTVPAIVRETVEKHNEH